MDVSLVPKENGSYALSVNGVELGKPFISFPTAVEACKWLKDNIEELRTIIEENCVQEND